MLHKLFRIIVLVSILASLSCQKPLLENASGPNKESVKAIENATATAGIPNTASIEDKIRNYCPHASVSERQRSEIEDDITLDITELNIEESIRSHNEANRKKIDNKIYSQDYFQIYIPDDMYVMIKKIIIRRNVRFCAYIQGDSVCAYFLLLSFYPLFYVSPSHPKLTLIHWRIWKRR